MFGADIEIIHESDEVVVLRVSYYAGDEVFEEWIIKHKDEGHP